MSFLKKNDCLINNLVAWDKLNFIVLNINSHLIELIWMLGHLKKRERKVFVYGGKFRKS